MFYNLSNYLLKMLHTLETIYNFCLYYRILTFVISKNVTTQYYIITYNYINISNYKFLVIDVKYHTTYFITFTIIMISSKNFISW